MHNIGQNIGQSISRVLGRQALPAAETAHKAEENLGRTENETISGSSFPRKGA
jgi:hypothetical protein